MKDTRKKELREKLVDLRRVSSVDTETHRRISDGEMVQLTKSMYFCAATWKKLKEYQRAFLQCYAAGCQSRRAVLIDCSAARLNGVWTIARNEPVTLAVPNGQPHSLNGARALHQRDPHRHRHRAGTRRARRRHSDRQRALRPRRPPLPGIAAPVPRNHRPPRRHERHRQRPESAAAGQQTFGFAL